MEGTSTKRSTKKDSYYFTVMIEQVQHNGVDDKGNPTKTSNPFPHIVYKEQWLRFLVSGRKLGYYIIDATEVPKGLPKSYEEYDKTQESK